MATHNRYRFYAAISRLLPVITAIEILITMSKDNLMIVISACIVDYTETSSPFLLCVAFATPGLSGLCTDCRLGIKYFLPVR